MSKGNLENKAENLEERFDRHQRRKLEEAKISLKTAYLYDKEFSGYEIIHLVKKGVKPQDANKYDLGQILLKADKIVELINKGISAEEVKELLPKYKYKGPWKNDMIKLILEGICPKEANAYLKSADFSADEIYSMKKLKISPQELEDVAQDYDKRFRERGGGLIMLVGWGVPPEQANSYNKSLNGSTISRFISKDIGPEQVNSYCNKIGLNNKIDALWADQSFEAGITGKLINEYNQIFDKKAPLAFVCLLNDIELIPSKIKKWDKKKRKQLYEFLDEILSVTMRYSGMDKSKYRYFNTGSSSVLLLKGDRLWKFSDNLVNERAFLGMLKDPMNVIRLKDMKNVPAIELECINGESLERFLKEQPNLPSEKILKYSSDIMNGLVEMRKAGIFYHRDIRPANVLIDEENDKAVICDLGIATTYRHALSKDNRRFGSISGKEANDLVSLGQVMYKMATGNHLFAESKSMEKTIYAEKIRDYRDEVYDNPELLKKHLNKVDETVKDEKIKNIIKSCLTSKNYDYGKMQKMFKSYLK